MTRERSTSLLSDCAKGERQQCREQRLRRRGQEGERAGDGEGQRERDTFYHRIDIPRHLQRSAHPHNLFYLALETRMKRENVSDCGERAEDEKGDRSGRVSEERERERE